MSITTVGKISTFRKIGTALLLTSALVCMSPSAAPARDVLFLGLTNNRGEPAQAQLEQVIRHEFSSNPNFRLMGETETQRFIREKERLGHRRTEPFIQPSAQLADSTIIIRGVVEEFSLTPRRRMLLWGKIDAAISIKFHFNEAAGPTAYLGEFRGASSKPKGFLLFANPQKTIHISAVDRNELSRKMQTEMIKELSEFTNLFFSSLATGPIHQRLNGEGEEDQFPGAGELMTGDD
ncbi:MAG: hypothetical protein LBC70_07185 [Chitinispirillales bacterium]|jgi:hypothetical protein|nr:hypothetical protein [Chitinispirillales bacterium]